MNHQWEGPIGLPEADPGFPVISLKSSRGRGAPTYDFAKFNKKLHEIENILDHRSATATTLLLLQEDFNIFYEFF